MFGICRKRCVDKCWVDEWMVRKGKEVKHCCLGKGK